MEKTLSEEEKQRINALLEKHRPRKEIQGKEMVILSEKGKEIGIETEVASSSIKPYEDRSIEHEEEASQGKYEVIGTDIETEYEEMDTEDEECEVRKLTKEELEIYHQYKEFYTMQARTKEKCPVLVTFIDLKSKNAILEYQLIWQKRLVTLQKEKFRI